MKKKILATILVAVLLTVTLVACGEGGGGSGGSQQVTIDFFGWEASPLETQSVRDGIAAFEEQFPNIKVEYAVSPGGEDYHARLLATAAGGAMPDVFFMGSDVYRQFAERGVLLEITDKFDDDFRLDDFLQSVRDIMVIEGRVFGIQSCIVSPHLFYNKTVFDNAGVAYPGTNPLTWEEYRQLAIQLTDGDIIGAYGHEVFWNGLNAFLESGGANLYAPDLWSVTINSPAARDVFLALRSLRVDDGAAADAVTLENIGMNAAQMLQTGRVAMLIDGSWALQELAQMDFELGLAPLPHFGRPLTTAQAHQHSIAADTDYPDESWEYLKFLSGMDYQGELVAAGLWLPNRYSMYEPDAVAQWYSEDIHGDYIHFLDYFMNANVQVNALARSPVAMSIQDEETSIFFNDGGDVDVMLQNIERRINEDLARIRDGN